MIKSRIFVTMILCEKEGNLLTDGWILPACFRVKFIELFWAAVFQPNMQGLSCEGACAHASVRCAVARMRVRAKSILKSVRDVRACGSLSGVRCAMALCTLFGTKRKENGIFLS